MLSSALPGVPSGSVSLSAWSGQHGRPATAIDPFGVTWEERECVAVDERGRAVGALDHRFVLDRLPSWLQAQPESLLGDLCSSRSPT